MPICANNGNLLAINKCRNWVIEILGESDFRLVRIYLNRLNKEVIAEILSENMIEKLHTRAREIALKKSDLEQFHHGSNLYLSSRLGWEDVVDCYCNNPEFINFIQVGASRYGHANFLEWSLTSKKLLTQQLVVVARQVEPASSYLDDEPERLLQLAITWKRSLET
jgi:hypothetical protein